MWDSGGIDIVLEASDDATALVRITTPVGIIDLIGEVSFYGDTMVIEGAHIDGPGAGRIGRRGLNAIGAKLLEVANVREVVIQGGTRTTGLNAGRPPRPFRYPNSSHPPSV